jgi:thioredoxin-related protein
MSGISVAETDTIRSPDTHFFHESFGDLQEELAIASSEQKFGVMIMFEENDCPWCERMKKTVFNRSTVQDFFRKNFQIIALNVAGDTMVTDFQGNEIVEKDFALKHNRIRATPTFLFFDLEGEMVARYTGAAKNPEEFIWLGQYVVERRYQTEKFIQYKRKKRQPS